MTILPTKYARIRLDDETSEPLTTELFTWTDRDSYLAWVAEWKRELRQRIDAIRRHKATRRDSTKEDTARRLAQSERHYLRIECANLFLIRQMAKQFSAQQKQQRLAMIDCN